MESLLFILRADYLPLFFYSPRNRRGGDYILLSVLRFHQITVTSNTRIFLCYHCLPLKRKYDHDHVVALNHTIEWPARSPDLTPCDFFLWGYLKSKVFQTPPDSIDDLKNRIVAEADRVKQNRNLIRRAVKDMVRRAHVCIDRDGGHVEGKFR